MNAKDAFDKMVSNLAETYDLREAENITKIYFEDVFNLKWGRRNTELDQQQTQRYEQDLFRLAGGEPVSYVTGKTIFYGYPYELDEHVLIPRPETEELVFWMESDLKRERDLKVLDIGTGSGCIAVSLAKLRPDFKVTASDVSLDAIKVAQLNAKLNQVEIAFINDDILSPDSQIDFNDYDVIVSNPPYIARDEQPLMSASTKAYEPELALYGEDDGLNFYRVFADKLKQMKSKQARLYLELNEFKAQQIIEIYSEAGFECSLKMDMQDKQRMLRVTSS